MLIHVTFSQLQHAAVFGRPHVFAEVNHANQVHRVVAVVMPDHRVPLLATLQHAVGTRPISHVRSNVLGCFAKPQLLHKSQVNRWYLVIL